MTAGARHPESAPEEIRKEFALVSIEGLGISFGGLTALEGFRLEIYDTDLVGLIGPTLAIGTNGKPRVAFADASHGVAVGNNGYMVETLDGGASWKVVDRETSVRLTSVSFRDGTSAIAGGAGGALILGDTR